MLGRAQREAAAAGGLRGHGRGLRRASRSRHPQRFRLMFGGQLTIAKHPALREVAPEDLRGSVRRARGARRRRAGRARRVDRRLGAGARPGAAAARRPHRRGGAPGPQPKSSSSATCSARRASRQGRRTRSPWARLSRRSRRRPRRRRVRACRARRGSAAAAAAACAGLRRSVLRACSRAPLRAAAGLRPRWPAMPAITRYSRASRFRSVWLASSALGAARRFARASRARDRGEQRDPVALEIAQRRDGRAPRLNARPDRRRFVRRQVGIQAARDVEQAVQPDVLLARLRGIRSGAACATSRSFCSSGAIADRLGRPALQQEIARIAREARVLDALEGLGALVLRR